MIFLGALFLGYSCSIQACSVYPKPTDADLYERANAIFVARVIETKLRVASPAKCDGAEVCDFVEGRYSLLEVIKGHPKKRGFVVDAIFGPGTCSVGLVAGWYYVFYTGKDGGVFSPSGSYSLGPWIREKDFGNARKISEPGHERVIEEG
jgi:hypothetical protein